MDYKIIDFHAHAFPDTVEEKAVKNLGDYYSINIQCRGIIESLIESADEVNVRKIVVHSTATQPGQVENINDWISNVVQEYDKVIGFGTLHPDYQSINKELDRIENLGLKGIKLHPDFQAFNIDDPKMYPIYDKIGNRFPILFHTGDENFDYSSPKRLSKVLELFPDLIVIAAHLGGYAQLDEAREFLYGRNLYIDTSSSLWRLDPDSAVDLIRAHGVEHVLFGTDFPIASHADELKRFMDLPLCHEEREKILWKNASELLNIEI